jgi:putative NADH-flavin reductase
MNIIIFGSNGGIGIQTLEQALADGHNVTAIARRPETIKIQHDCLQVIRGDVMDLSSIIQPMKGQEVVVSAIGVTQGRVPTTVYSAGVANIMQAMTQAGVRRLLCISASGLNPGPWYQRLIAKPLLWLAFKEAYSDMVRMETAVQASALDWTIIRPPRLTDKQRIGHYQIALNRQLRHGAFISRADVADYILNHLTDAQTYHGMVEIAY